LTRQELKQGMNMDFFRPIWSIIKQDCLASYSSRRRGLRCQRLPLRCRHRRLYLKVGTGIGCGIIADGRLHRGAQDSAGDIGHLRVGGREDLCRCGTSGCMGRSEPNPRADSPSRVTAA
jgi:hypothetical protein